MIMMNHNLEIFIKVADSGSFTATAEEMFISQPAISRAIKSLENELNLKLFHRDKRKGLILTSAGEKILLLARQMADIENRIYQTAFRENNFLGGKVKVASMPIFSSMILSKVFHDFHEKYPYVTLELMEGSAAKIRKAVEEHQVDFGMTSSPFEDLDFEVVLQDQILAVTTDETRSEPVDLYHPEDSYILCRAGFETVLEEMRGEKINLSNSFLVEQAETAIHFVEQGNGTGILAEFFLNCTPNQLHRLPTVPEIKIDIGLVANSLDDLTPVAQVLINMIREECKKYRDMAKSQ